MKKHLLVIGGRDHTIQKIINMGIDYTIFQTPELVTDLQRTTSKRLIVNDYTKDDEVLAVAKAIHVVDEFDAVVSFAEYGMHVAALCGKELNLPSNDIDPVLNTRDKIKMRTLLKAHNLGTVNFKVCHHIDDVKEFFINKPIIIKPFSGGGSCGVALIKHEDEIQKAWEWAIAEEILPLIAEEYIEGKEYSVESVSLKGKHEVVMITEKETTGSPKFIETGHQAPARLSAILESEIIATVKQLLTVIGQKTAPAHTEIKVTTDGIKIIESQTRIGGDQIWEMTEMVSGVDQMSEVICELLSLPQPKRKARENAAAIRFFTYENVRILSVDNIENAKSEPNTIRMNCTLEAGQKIGDLLSSDSRQGYVLCRGSSTENALINAENALNLVSVNSVAV